MSYHTYQKSFLLLLFTLLIFIYLSDTIVNEGSVNANLREKLPEKIVILYWTTWFHREPTVGKSMMCGMNCFMTSNRSYLNVSDALVFHSRDIGFNYSDMPTLHHENQIWVYMQQESPVLTWTNLTILNGMFNWTMTYRRDSDVFHPYFKMLSEPTDLQSRMSQNKLKEKTKLVAWIVSNCNANSSRRAYVQQLQKFVDVDIYGKCGTLECPRNGSGCFPEVGRKYKFYLSFENAYCTDYITEKFLNAVKYNLVPVVMGGGNYEELAPPKSFINVDEFDSPAALASYLIYLDRNQEEYLKYFEWQAKFKVIQSSGWCELCEKLNEQRKNSKRKIYEDLWKWWYFVEQEDLKGFWKVIKSWKKWV